MGGFLKPFIRSKKAVTLEKLPAGCYAVHREGGIVGSTVSSTFSTEALDDIAKTVLRIFAEAQESDLALHDLHIRYEGITITARELRGGALIFLNPATLNLARPDLPKTMNYKNIEEFILHLENYIECWKQFNYYVNQARERKFTRDDENHFLEVKSIIAQGLESIIAATDKGAPRKEEVSALMADAPSLRYLADSPEAVPQVEAQWHRVYLALQSLLGQLKVQADRQSEKSGGWSLFGGKK